VTGAEPLFFLDYIACGKVKPAMLTQVVKGIVRGCREAGCALLGGETAELPGLYGKDQWDLAGFCVGLVDKSRLIDGRKCRPGDAVVGLASSGLHSNGYSLARRVFTKKELAGPFGRTLLRPTRIYTRLLLEAMAAIDIKAMAHITGGGMYGNVIRVIPKGLDIDIDFRSWERPKIFDLIQSAGIEEDEMRKVFNLGIGYVFIVDPDEVHLIEGALSGSGESIVRIGRVVKCTSRA